MKKKQLDERSPEIERVIERRRAVELTAPDAAAYSNMSYSKFRALLSAGKGPARIRRFSQTLFPTADLDIWLKENETHIPAGTPTKRSDRLPGESDEEEGDDSGLNDEGAEGAGGNDQPSLSVMARDMPPTESLTLPLQKSKQ